ncbi:hypothetical protein [Zhongshania sp.]|uniref:pilus assembly PilX family protein n=1 Tax=Zhongshania sp. TaxID=1971902 RepID=UPI0035685291
MMSIPKQISTSTQRGVVLIVVLIMLGVFSVIVVSMIGGSNINFKIAGNQQYRMEAKLAARNGVESYISNPANFALPLPTSNAYVNSDFNGDGVADMVAVVAPPECLRAVPILQAELDVTDPQDAQCVGSAQQSNSGLFYASGSSPTGNSWCSKMTWDVGAAVNDTKTGVALAMHQGVYLRAIIGTTCL